MLSRNCINRISGLFYRTITPCASDFRGNLTIANNVNLRLITKVICGAWRPIVTNHNALGLYAAPFWNLSRWRVELRRLGIRNAAQGDPTNRSGLLLN